MKRDYFSHLEYSHYCFQQLINFAMCPAEHMPQWISRLVKNTSEWNRLALGSIPTTDENN